MSEWLITLWRVLTGGRDQSEVAQFAAVTRSLTDLQQRTQEMFVAASVRLDEVTHRLSIAEDLQSALRLQLDQAMIEMRECDQDREKLRQLCLRQQRALASLQKKVAMLPADDHPENSSDLPRLNDQEPKS